MAARKTNTPKVESANVEAGATTEATVKTFPTTEQMIKDGLTTKSARIRHLHAMGMPTGDIARQETGGLYQHAYNVIKKPLKRKESATTETESATETTDSASKEGEKAEA